MQRKTIKEIILVNSKQESVTVSAEIADTPGKKALGLMFRKKLAQNQGMLFIFDKPCKPSFWMLWVSFPIEAIFFSEDGRAIEIINMKPGLTPLFYKPNKPAIYVLEVNKGFSQQNRITKDSRLILEK